MIHITERVFVLDEVDLPSFLGPNNAMLLLWRTLYPKLRMLMHGNLLKVMGASDEIDRFALLMGRMIDYGKEFNQLSEEVVLRLNQGLAPNQNAPDNLILYGVAGKAIVARGDNQRRMVDLFSKRDLLFAIGPAGTGKTFIAISLAVKALKSKQVRRIILSRPAVEAGEKLGFLPGEMKDKLDPYLQPLYDALEEMIPAPKLKEYIETNIIQIAPLAFMRGRTLNDAVVILDEAQNTSVHQMKMFLTRLGANAKMIVTGDVTQIDLPFGVRSGLKQSMDILGETPGVGWLYFEKKDIVRHPLVQRIVEAYEAHHQQEQIEKQRLHEAKALDAVE